MNVSSGAGACGLPMISLYNASKIALEGFSESLSYKLASQGITVKIVEPGAVLNTDLGARSSDEFGSASVPAGYEKFVTATGKVFEGLRASRHAASQDVVKVIFEATTDGTDRLRYVATEDIQPLVQARRETSEEAYIHFMREQFRA